SGDDSATMMLIAQAVKSQLPLADAIRLGVEDRLQKPGSLEKALLRFAERLEKGEDPKLAVTQAGLPKQTVGMFEMALKNSDFAATFDELARLEAARVAAIHRLALAFAYPVFLCVTMLLALVLFLVFIVPGFAAIFDDFGVELPFVTEIVLRFSRLMTTGTLVVGLIVFFAVLFAAQRLLFPRFWYLIPLFGSVARRLCICRMLRQMACLVHQNVPLPEALEQCGKTMRNAAYRQDCRDAAESARKGMSFAEITLRYDWLFPVWLAPMINAVKSDGDLAKSLRRAAETADQQKEGTLLFVQSISMPLFVVVIFGGMAILVTAMFMPMVELITNLSSNKI
ncbi:MAG: type II secretion system F family protein, partial [Planctomycetaceae bacterium]|nr:type II secretion system F family protein [Planctomycetaceae bacterium]